MNINFIHLNGQSDVLITLIAVSWALIKAYYVIILLLFAGNIRYNYDHAEESKHTAISEYSVITYSVTISLKLLYKELPVSAGVKNNDTKRRLRHFGESL